MASKIETFVAWKILWYLYKELSTIRQANGYNTNPLVTYEYHKAKESTVKNTVFVEVESHNTVEDFVGGSTANVGRRHQQLSILVAGYTRPEAEPYRKAAMALEQDTRNALEQAFKDIQTELGRGFSCKMTNCLHDIGLLAPTEQAAFELSVVVTYSQGNTW